MKKHIVCIENSKHTEEICIVSTIKCCVNRDQYVSWGGVTIYLHIHTYQYDVVPPVC